MASAGEIGEVLQLSLTLFEGNFTRRDVVGPRGKVQFHGTYSQPLAVGDFVEIYASADNTVTTASAGASIIGRVITEPEGQIPNVSTDGGTWTWSASVGNGARYATIEWYKGKCVRRLVSHSAATRGVQVELKNKTTVITGSGTAIGVLLESASSGSTVSVLVY